MSKMADWISIEQYREAADTKNNGAMQTLYIYDGFIESISDASISSKSEAAKYLAHIVWETHGMKYTREIYAQDPANKADCIRAYGQGPNGVIYYGRGPLQLSHQCNYSAASRSLYGDNRLVNNPDLVATDSVAAWGTASHFWRTNVHKHSETFESTLQKINGPLEGPGGPNAHIGRQRREHYKEILRILGLSTKTP